MTVLQYSEPPYIALAKMPGRYGIKSGYVYAIVCESRIVKIGSSVRPRSRIGEQCYGGGLWIQNETGKSNYIKVNELILSGAHRKCRELEEALHRALKPHHNSEKYKLSCELMRSLKKLFSTPLSESRITAFAKQIWSKS